MKRRRDKPKVQAEQTASSTEGDWEATPVPPISDLLPKALEGDADAVSWIHWQLQHHTEGFKRSALKGDIELAVGALHQQARYLTELLELLAEHRPDLLVPIARYEHEWPTFIHAGRKPRNARERLILAELKLGQKSLVRGDVRFSLQRTLAHNLLGHVTVLESLYREGSFQERFQEKLGKDIPDRLEDWFKKASSLPEFDRSNWEEWYKVCWEWVLITTNDAPEDSAPYKLLGDSARKAAKERMSTETYVAGVLRQTPPKGRAAGSTALDKIRTRLQEGFEAIAKEP